jgi:hypothetical protein
MKVRHPVVIYDSYALNGLRALSHYHIAENDYATYYVNWMDFFANEEIHNQITSACNRSHNSHYAAALIDRGVATPTANSDVGKRTVV